MDVIAQQQHLLATHRQRLAVLLAQQAQLGSAHTPPGIITDIAAARAEIRRITAYLREQGVAVADLPDDAEPPAMENPRPPAPGAVHTIQVGNIIGSTGVAIGDGASAHVTTINHYHTPEQRRRLEDYLTLLRHLAATERARALCDSDPPLTHGLPMDTLRLAMARAAMVWDPLADLEQAQDDDAFRRSLVAWLLLPLATTKLMLYTLRSEHALSRLGSPKLSALVLSEAVPYVRRSMILDADAQRKAQLQLALKLRDPVYAEGCARLLTDLTETEEGRTALAVAFQEYQADGGASPPAFIHLVAAGLFGGAVSGGVLLAATAVLRSFVADDEGENAPASSPGRLRIPLTPAEWRAELGQRNQHFGAPNGYWCYVRPGTYRIGGWEPKDPAANLRLNAFWVARVPFTVAQYAQFLRAGGYHTRRWWTPIGWAWRTKRKIEQPYRWQEGSFNSRAEQALQGITWYEAAACGAWLAEELRFDLPAGYTLRLPTEAEWEVAAAYGPRGQRFSYPWGEQEPTAKLAVFNRKWEEGAPDVATCPAGAAACGALDMVGTVWEWCSSDYNKYPQAAHALAKGFITIDWLATPVSVPLRGGSYYSSETDVRCGARDGVLPDFGNLGYGFRVVVAPPLAHAS
nr:SUMF1/EgtB/PvdO family nonheme iron enzyme [Oscillochloris trichoides]